MCAGDRNPVRPLSQPHYSRMGTVLYRLARPCSIRICTHIQQVHIPILGEYSQLGQYMYFNVERSTALNASSKVSTNASPAKLNDVLRIIGTPVLELNSSISS